MRHLCLVAVVLGGCNLLTDFDTGFLPGPTDAAVDRDATPGPTDASSEADGGEVDAGSLPPCQIVGGPTSLDEAAPVGVYPAIDAFEDELAVAYVGPLDPDLDGWSRLQVHLGACDALDGETVNLEESELVTDDASQPDAAWNPVNQSFGVTWTDGATNEFAKWNSVRRGAGGLELGLPRFLQPPYDASTYDLRWPRVSVTDGQWALLVEDVADTDRHTTVRRFYDDPWPPDLETEVIPWKGDGYLAVGAADVAGRADTPEYHYAIGIGSPGVLRTVDYLTEQEIIRGSAPLLNDLAKARIAAVDDVLPAYWTAEFAAPAAIVAQRLDGSLAVLYPDLSDEPLAVAGATHVIAHDVVAVGSLLVVTWLEDVDRQTEVRVAVAELQDGEVVAQSDAMSIGIAGGRGFRGVSAAVLTDGQRVAVSWSEPDASRFSRVRLACLVCAAPPLGD